jgi:archaellum component FlaC
VSEEKVNTVEKLRERLSKVMDETSVLVSAPLVTGKISNELIPAVDEYRRKANAIADGIMRLYYIAKNKLDRIDELPGWMVSEIEVKEAESIIEDLEIRVKQLKKSYEELKQRIQEDMRFRENLHFNESAFMPFRVRE